MSLSHFTAHHVRNLTRIEIEPSPRLNLIFGPNGSGKTSLIEALFLLGRAKSFRSTRLEPVIQHQQSKLTVHGTIKYQHSTPVPIGVERSKDRVRFRIGGENVASLAELVARLPLQLIVPESHRLLEQGPRFRRQFLDWGLFHVEQSFHGQWRAYQKILKQRNALLRAGGVNPRQLNVWDQELIQSAEILDSLRRRYVTTLLPEFRVFMNQLTGIDDISLDYRQGWKQDISYADALLASREHDLTKGYTRCGPHCADLQIQRHGVAVIQAVSRGQQKQIVSALCLAQAKILAERTQQECILLIDDLPSELDPDHRKAFLEVLQNQRCQVFISATDTALFDGIGLANSTQMFHVEHGTVRSGLK